MIAVDAPWHEAVTMGYTKGDCQYLSTMEELQGNCLHTPMHSCKTTMSLTLKTLTSDYCQNVKKKGLEKPATHMLRTPMLAYKAKRQ